MQKSRRGIVDILHRLVALREALSLGGARPTYP
eukprot:COSAG02_NODE_43714_length_372_cov_0.897436_1_plen_32_part_10